MNIAYVIYPGACYVGKGDGSKMQAMIWKNQLQSKGHHVDLIDPWQGYPWEKYDIIHVFGFGLWIYDFIYWGTKLNPNFVFSPIIDTNTPLWAYKIASHIGCKKAHLFSQNYALRLLKDNIKLFFTRTNYEALYLKNGYNISNDKIINIPLSYRFDNDDSQIEKEPFCLFVGTMTQKRKNVYNLIKAAIKYKFKLILVGNTGNQISHNNLLSLTENHPNIIIKGFVSEQELCLLYNKAKVFALPSFNEGVGLAALEAAVHRCNIVITKLGGPKEYYDNKAYLVSPYSVDEIGKAIIKAINDNTMQPELRNSIIKKYNPELCTENLIKAYDQLIK